MKAFVYSKYGSLDSLRLEEIEQPAPKAGQVLVKLKATSLNGSDKESLLGKPLYARIWGWFKPRFRILGSDIAGVVEEVGEGVTEFKKGDRVFGDMLGEFGGFGQYAAYSAKKLSRIPDALTFEIASALPQAGVIAMQGMLEERDVKAGDKVLINGGGGASGSLAIQLARHLGAHVTAVDNGDKLDFMRSLGADEVLDYKLEDFTKRGVRYDYIFDVFSTRSTSDHRRALAPDGKYGMVGGTMRSLFSALILGAIGKPKCRVIGIHQNRESLAKVCDLVAGGKMKPIIGSTYSFEDIPEAMKQLIEGKALGKTVIRF